MMESEFSNSLLAHLPLQKPTDIIVVERLIRLVGYSFMHIRFELIWIFFKVKPHCVFDFAQNITRFKINKYWPFLIVFNFWWTIFRFWNFWQSIFLFLNFDKVSSIIFITCLALNQEFFMRLVIWWLNRLSMPNSKIFKISSVLSSIFFL